MTTVELKARTKDFALCVIRLVDALPTSVKGCVIANQIIRSATSVAANYRAACRARSRVEFIAKIGVVEEEPDETAFWLELISIRRSAAKRISNRCLKKQANSWQSWSRPANRQSPIGSRQFDEDL